MGGIEVVLELKLKEGGQPPCGRPKRRVNFMQVCALDFQKGTGPNFSLKKRRRPHKRRSGFCQEGVCMDGNPE